MRLYQSNFEENTTVGAIGNLILYSFLFLIPDDGLNHTSINPIAISVFTTINLLKISLVYFNRNKHYEEVLGFLLISASALFWVFIYLSEIVLSENLNQIGRAHV